MPSPSWYLDEVRYAGPEHLDEAFVAAYDAKQQTDWAPELQLLREHGLDSAKTLVDLGTGTGALALAVAPYIKRVVAVDISPAMLAFVRRQAQAKRLANLDCVQAGFLSYEHTGAPADFIYTRNALHHLPDFWKGVALQRLAAMLPTGGILRLRDLVYAFAPQEATQRLEAWFAGAKVRREDGYTRSEYETHLRDEYSTYSWLLEPMLQRAGFEIRFADYSPNKIYAAYLCVKRAA